jgi:hypothetical protein
MSSKSVGRLLIMTREMKHELATKAIRFRRQPPVQQQSRIAMAD